MSKRKERRAARQGRMDARSQRKANRIAARNERRETRQENRTQRALGRQQTKATAYEHGIDPNAWIADSIGHAADAAGDVWGGLGAAKHGPGGSAGGKGTGLFGNGGLKSPSTKTADLPSGDNQPNFAMIGGIALAAYFFMKK